MTPSPSASPASPIKFGTSGWRGLIADDFTFANVRLAVTAIAGHVNDAKKNSTILVGYDPRFYSEEFSQLAVDILQQHKIKTLLCETFTPTPAVAYEIQRTKIDGAINFTASHNPAQYHGLKFWPPCGAPAPRGHLRERRTRGVATWSSSTCSRKPKRNLSSMRGTEAERGASTRCWPITASKSLRCVRIA